MKDFFENFLMIFRGIIIKFFPCLLGVCFGFTFIVPLITNTSFDIIGRFFASLISCAIVVLGFALIMAIVGPFLDKE